MNKNEFEREKNVVVDEIIRSNDNTESQVNEKIYKLILQRFFIREFNRYLNKK